MPFRPLHAPKVIRQSTFLDIPRAAECSYLNSPLTRPVHCSRGFQSISRGRDIGIPIRRPVPPNKPLIQKAYATMPKAAFYAVAVGRRPGVYTTWTETEAQIKGYPSAKHKKFNHEREAIDWIAMNGGPSLTPTRKTPIQTPLWTSTTTTTFPSKPRQDSPPVHALLESLLEEYAKLAAKGWKFSRKLPHALVVYTDGSGLGNGQHGAKAGVGVWWGDTGDAGALNLSERVPGELQTNNRGELLSVIRALEICPFPDIPMEIRTDSQYTIKCMTTYLSAWLKSGRLSSSAPSTHDRNTSTYKELKNADLIRHLLVLLRRRKVGADVRFKYVPGHSGVEGNEGADRLAKMGALMPPLPDREKWLNPVEEEPKTSTAAMSIEIDEEWLLTPEQLEQFEKGIEEDD